MNRKEKQAQKVIIQDDDNESALKVLQRRFARSEVILEEFHQLKQRS